MVQVVSTQGYAEQTWLAGTDTSVTLPNGPVAGGAPIAFGFEIQVMDSAGTASSSNITIHGQIGSTATTGTATISTAGGTQTFIWGGAFWSAAIA